MPVAVDFLPPFSCRPSSSVLSSLSFALCCDCSSVMFVWLDCFFSSATALYSLLLSMSCHTLFLIFLHPSHHLTALFFLQSHFFLFISVHSAPHAIHLHTRFCLYPVADAINQTNSPKTSPVNQSSGPTTSPVNRSLLLY